MDFVIGLDLGTAGSRAVAVGADGRILAVASAAHPSLLTGDGQVEQDPAGWWASAAAYRCFRHKRASSNALLSCKNSAPKGG